MTPVTPDPPYKKPVPYPDSRFKPLTSNCDDMPTFFVDTQAPLDILIDSAIYRIGAVTQVLENMSMRGTVECDVLEAVSQRLRPRTQGVFTA